LHVNQYSLKYITVKTILYNKHQMKIEYPEIGICGLSCRLCPRYQTNTASKCDGCKSIARITLGCPFITCAIKKKGVEFCWDCKSNEPCEKWNRHCEAGKEHDSFKSYRKLEDDINFIKKYGVEAYNRQQEIRESLLLKLLNEFNEGRSKSYYCIAVTVMDIDELENALEEAYTRLNTQYIKERSKIMHSILDRIASKKDYHLQLRK
jgi:hypothetical protein